MDASLAREQGEAPGLIDLLVGRDTTTPWWIVVTAAGLLLAVGVIHLQDQGGLLGGESPAHLKYGYYLVEIVSAAAAVLLLRGRVFGWLLGLGVTVLPLIGYILTRTTGLPQDSGDIGDIGNWGYILGIVALAVEGAYVVLAAVALHRINRQMRAR